MKRELTLANIAGYLPHGLKVIYKNARHYGVFDIENTSFSVGSKLAPVLPVTVKDSVEVSM